MKLKQLVNNIKMQLTKRKNLLLVLSLVFTFVMSIYNRVLGAITHSLWHEAISIYYFVLVAIRTIIVGYIHKNKARSKDTAVFIITKILLILLNTFLALPIILMVTDKRPVTMSLIPSIAIALYTTIKTTTTIMGFVKTRKDKDVLARELKVINLMDVVVSILTLQNTLIAVNSTESDLEGMHILTIVTSAVGFLFNMYLIFALRRHHDDKVELAPEDGLPIMEEVITGTDDTSTNDNNACSSHQDDSWLND